MTPKPQGNKTIQEILIDVIERAENYKHNNDISILRTGDLNKWFIPEATQAITQAMLDALPEKKIKDTKDYINIGFNQAVSEMKSAIKLMGE